MEERYRRNVPALTEEECALLQTKQVLIVGCGGLGGYLLELLLRIGVGRIRLCDGDVFEASNLNRQLLSQASALGTAKAAAARERARLVNPRIALEAFDAPMTRENVSRLVQGCDVVLDALDSIESRRILSDACSRAGVPCVFGAIGGWTAQAALSLPGDNLLEVLYPRGAISRDEGVLSFTPALCASVQAALCVKLLTGRPVESGKIYCFDLLHQEFETLSLF